MVTIAQFDQDRYAATDEVRCITIYVPDDDSYMPLLAGLLALPSYLENYHDPESAQAEGVAAVWRDAYIQTDWSGCVTPSATGNQSRVSLWHRWLQVTTGNPIGTVLDASQLFGHYVRQNPAADGDDGYQDIWLPAGDYDIRVVYVRITSNARLTVIFQNQADMSQVIAINQADLYGTIAYGQVVSAQFTLTEPGHYRVFFLANGKNASSSNYFLPLTVTEIWKTADL